MGKKFYITTTLPYVNADPHIGFALEIVQADTVARLKRSLGYDVFFNFGTDEHGLKIYRKAVEAKMNPKEYTDMYAKKFDDLKKFLNLSYNNFIRTTDEHHITAAQEFWKRSQENGDIYKKIYKVKYCVGCELEKTDSELENNRCPIHPSQEIELIEEENYFFRFSKYQSDLLDHYRRNPDFVIPSFRLKEISTFVEGGITDFSISRLKEKMPWGVPVPNDPDHVMYVWFDALINYISALGWPENERKFNDFWPGIQVAGKDNLRQQSAIWQAMLLSANLPLTKQIFIHGFITANGQKISKSLGNAVDPYELVNKYGTDALRYYLLSQVHPYEDSDFTYEKFDETYTSDLANGLGNLVARVRAMISKTELEATFEKPKSISSDIVELIELYEFNKAIQSIWKKIKAADLYVNENEVWKLVNEDKTRALKELRNRLVEIAYDLSIFLPETSEKIFDQLGRKEVKIDDILFPRLS